MVRWDSPLFTVSWTDEDVPAENIWKAITEGTVKPPNAGTQVVSMFGNDFVRLVTRSEQTPKAPTDALRTLENTATSMVAAIMAELAASPPSGGPVMLSLSDTLKSPITLPPRNVTLSELQRLKRQFVTVHKKAITLGTIEKGQVDWSEESVANKFAAYVEGNLRP